MTNASHHFTYDSDHEEDEQQVVYDGKDVSIFVIDCNGAMFEQLKYAEGVELNARCRYEVCLSVLESLFLNKLRHNNSNEMVSVLLYNTEKSDTKGNLIAPDHCAILFPLQEVDVDITRFIKNSQDSEDFLDFANKYGHSTKAKLADVLWLCQSVISETKVRNLSINWFTNISEPHAKGSLLFKEAIEKADEFQYFQPNFQLVELKENFEFESFYSTFILHVAGRDEELIVNPGVELDLSSETFISKIVSRLSNLDYHNRALSYLTMELGGKSKFGVGIYGFVRSNSEPKSVKLDRVTKQLVESKRYYKYGTLPTNVIFEEDVDRSLVLNERLTADKTLKTLTVGNEKVKFTPLEAYEMKQVLQPMIRLLGFKPLSTLDKNLHLRKPYFLYPSDKFIKGSTSAFRALWEGCLRNNVYALCILTMRLKSNPKHVALIPQQEDHKINTFDGFRMEYLPYASDIRDLSSMYCTRSEECDEIDELMVEMIRKLKIKYSPILFKSPMIEKIYNKIESKVFDEDLREFEDNTFPHLDMQEARSKDIIEKMKEIIGEFDTGVVKRKADSEAGNQAKKAAIDINEEMILEKCQKGEVKSLTVAILKDYLKIKNVSGLTKMTKNQLVEKIVEIG